MFLASAPLAISPLNESRLGGNGWQMNLENFRRQPIRPDHRLKTDRRKLDPTPKLLAASFSLAGIRLCRRKAFVLRWTPAPISTDPVLTLLFHYQSESLPEKTDGVV